MKRNTKERGYFKELISSALFKNKELLKILVGDTQGKSNKEIRNQFKKHVKSHLFVDGTIEEEGTFIFYDIVFPYINANTKNCSIILYAICSRKILDSTVDSDFSGNLIDVVSQMVEDTLLNDEDLSNSFGIGSLELSNTSIYNSVDFYGVTMEFNVPNFR